MLIKKVYEDGHSHFQQMSGGQVNATELVASLICKQQNLIEGIQYAQEVIEGSMSIMIMTKDGVYVARDRMGRTLI